MILYIFPVCPQEMKIVPKKSKKGELNLLGLLG